MLHSKNKIQFLYPLIDRFKDLLHASNAGIQKYTAGSSTDRSAGQFTSPEFQHNKEDDGALAPNKLTDVVPPGYEWLSHSSSPKHPQDTNPRIKFGGSSCAKPYFASPLNIAALRYGTLTTNVIRALNSGAKIGGFSHNTGEGNLSPYLLEAGGDIVWQIGTGYLGCHTADGRFNPDMFQKSATLDVVKMIEVDLKPTNKHSRSGALPTSKLAEEITRIRTTSIGSGAERPSSHTAFTTPLELLDFVDNLRKLSGGKPVGINLCIDSRIPFLAFCKAMLATGQYPDFVTINGHESNLTSTDPTNSVGTPLKDALIFVNQALVGIGFREKVKVVASGKFLSAFHLLRAVALGADTVNSARGMMMALGGIQVYSTNTDPSNMYNTSRNMANSNGLVVNDMANRIADFHQATIEKVVELMGAGGLETLDQLKPGHINHREKGAAIKTYAQLYPSIIAGSLLDEKTIPDDWQDDWKSASSQQW